MSLGKAILLAIACGNAIAQQTGYGQCGGVGWTGPTTCVSWFTCVYRNDYYSQCVPGSGSPTTTTKFTTTSAVIKASSTTRKKTTTSLKTPTTSSKPATTSSKTTTTASGSTPSSGDTIQHWFAL
ncbi:Endoglucanase-5 [Arthrobotrys entomopaga]|nr:Endoglucanase-5 [Arthrobotrys entomopaga]